MIEEQMILVNAKDEIIGSEGKLVTHQLGLLHRAFSVFIFKTKQDQIELLLQQRQLNKYHSAGLWTNTCCSHPRFGETIVAAAKRRLFEEMGFATDLIVVGNFIYRSVFSNGLVEHEFDHILVGEYRSEIISVNAQEVAAYRWESVINIKNELTKSPELYTPWFSQAFLIAVDYLRSNRLLCIPS